METPKFPQNEEIVPNCYDIPVIEPKHGRDPKTGHFLHGNNFNEIGKYKEEYCDLVDEYLNECKDGFTKITDGEDTKVIKKVKLPTIEGFAIKLDVVVNTLYSWAEEHPRFMKSLDKILHQQKERLANEGLAGNYNPVIAKLILSANHGMREGKDVTTGGQKIVGNKIEFIDCSDDSYIDNDI